MAIDLSRFAAAYHEEAIEHLATMESLLISISPEAPGEENLNAIFRAVHSIKGGAGAFGHVDLGNFTHKFESVLDRVRKGEIGLTKASVGIYLRAVDVLRAHVQALRAGTTPSGDAFEAMAQEIEAAAGSAPSAIVVQTTKPVIFDESEDDGFGFFDDEPLEPVKAAAVAPAEAVEAIAQTAVAVDTDSIRINVAKMDELVNLMGELVITQAMIARSAAGRDSDAGRSLADAVAQLDRNTRDLQRSILSIRMLPLRHVTCRLPRLVRDVAERLGKEVELEMHGEDTELDKGLIEKLADPLMHLVRNAIDHGVEAPEVRAAAGKPAHGKLIVRARHEGGKVVISIADDGAGLDRAAILAKARASAIAIDDDASDADVWALILRAGFSTAQSVTDVSGRGVGMDVVHRNVLALGGTLEIASSAGEGATFTLRLPLTLAIIEGMSIVADGESYIVPLTAVAQSVRPDACEIRTIGGREVIRFNGDYIPLMSLAELFGGKRAAPCEGGIHVVLDIDGRQAALRADALLGLHQTVVKGLEDNYKRVEGISGATILGDGRVALILDAQRIVERATSTERLAA